MQKTAAQEAYAQFRKTAQGVMYDAYGNPVESQSNLPVLSMLLGGGLGGAGAHFIFPTERARKLRELASAIPESAVEAAKAGPRKWVPGVTDWPSVKYQVKPHQATKFRAPADVLKQFYKSKALGANATRLLAGLGIGAMGGYLGQRFIE